MAASSTTMRKLWSWAVATQALLSGAARTNGAILSERYPSSPDYDVIVVGGGYSGLMAAHDLNKAGLHTLVLEAKDDIGGKTRSIQLESGPGIVELGATWINNITQPEVYKLTEHFGLKTLVQYTAGDTVFQDPTGNIVRIPPASPPETDNSTGDPQAQLFEFIDAAAQQVDLYNSSSFPEDQDLSVEDWFKVQDLWSDPEVQATVSFLTISLVGREPDEIGVHYWLDYIKSGLGLQSLSTEDQGGAQFLMIESGTQSLARALAKTLGSGNVIFNSPVTKIVQQDGISTVFTKMNQTFTAKKVVVANTLHTYSKIEFSPPLPCDKNLLVARTHPGNYAKVILTYSEPWWRSAGLVGKFISLVGPVRFSWEISNPELSQYSLAIFVSGDVATCWHAENDEVRKSSVVNHLATLVGEELAPAALDVLETNYVEWTKEEYIWGAPTTSHGPGMLRKYGGALREPFENIHFAGTELAYEWKGYLEGAITSGQRAAKEIIDDI